MRGKGTQNAINTLVVELENYLLTKNYSSSTLKPYIRTWQEVNDYAEKNGYVEAKTDWVMPFIRKRNKNNVREVSDRAIYACKLLCSFQKAKTTGIAPRWMEGTEPQSSICALAKKTEQYLLANNYPQGTIRQYRHVWHQLADYAYEHDHNTIEDEWLKLFLSKRYQIGSGELSSQQRAHRRAAEMLRDFQNSGSIPRCRKRSAYGEEITEYQCFFETMEKYCSANDLSAHSKRYYLYHIRRFTSFLLEHKICSNEINAEHVREYLLSLSGMATSTVGQGLYVLRNVMRTAYMDGHISSDLSLVCDRTRSFAGSKIPSAYSPEDVQLLLEAVDRENPTGKRDYAILLLGARLGLRAGDIRMMTFENIHWDSHEIRLVQSKTNNEIALPLSEEIGWAIIDYLKHGRPDTKSKYIFVRHRAPYAPFGITNSLGAIIGKYFRRADVCIPEGKKHGMHVLRHSLASNMLAAGIPIPILAEALDHADIKTTMQYIKIDIAQLRSCALETELGGDCE